MYCSIGAPPVLDGGCHFSVTACSPVPGRLAEKLSGAEGRLNANAWVGAVASAPRHPSAKAVAIAIRDSTALILSRPLVSQLRVRRYRAINKRSERPRAGR